MQTTDYTETGKVKADWQDNCFISFRQNQLHMKIIKKEPSAEDLVQEVMNGKSNFR